MPENTTATDITQQATAPTPPKKPATEKNPKRVAAGKMVAERTKRAHEAQKKAAEEARDALANNKTPTAVTDGPAPQPSGGEKSFYSILTTTQWLAVGSLVVSLIGLYYKREEIKNALNPQPQASQPQASQPHAAEPQQAA